MGVGDGQWGTFHRPFRLGAWLRAPGRVITQGRWALTRLCRKSFQTLVAAWAWSFSVQLQGLVSCCQDLCLSAWQPLATGGQFLVTIDRSWTCRSSFALTTFQVLRSHTWLLVASVSGKADVNLSIITESSVGQCYVDGPFQSLSLDHLADKILSQAKPGTPSPPIAGTLTLSWGPL